MSRRGRLLITLALTLVVTTTSFVVVVFSYDENTTHPAITDEIVKFYNLSFPDQPISSQEKNWIVQGSIDEDTMPRWINHFYDPINNTGWTAEEAGRFSSSTFRWLNQFLLSDKPPLASRYWAQAPLAQAEYKSFLGNRTWQRAVYELSKNNNRQEAFYTLGFILHLIEDASVPDHTRNDTHAHDLQQFTGDYGSPYEEYAKARYYLGAVMPVSAESLKRQGVKLKIFTTLNDYFNEVAGYSNRYFFSKDTIPENPLATASVAEISKRKYRYPEVIFYDNEFGYGVGPDGSYYPITRLLVSRDGIKTKIEFTLNNPDRDKEILNAYFIRLSREAIVNGAGVIKLFFDEVKKVQEQEKSLTELPLETDGVKSVLATIKIVEEFINTVYTYFKPTTGTISIPLPKPVPLQWIAQSQLPAARAAGGGTLSNSLAQSQTLFVSESRADASKNNLTTASDLTHPYPAQAGTATGVPSSFAQVSLDRPAPTAVEDHRFLGIGTGGETKPPSSNTTAAALLGAAVLGALAVAVRPRVTNSNSATRPALFSPPQPNYAKNIFYQPEDTIQYGAGSKPPGNNVTWRPPNGQPGDAGRWILTIPGFYFSNLSGVYRQITDFQNSGIDPATIQPGRFGGEPNSAGPVTAGGAQSWEQYKNGAYAMDPEIREAVDEMNNFQSALSPLPLSPASEFVRHYWPVQFRPDLTNAQQESIRHMLDTRMNENAVLNEIDAKNFAYATSQNDWQKFLGKRPVELF